jgi:hypothetical protein
MPPPNPLPDQLASQAEYILDNLQQTNYQFLEEIDFVEDEFGEIVADTFACDCNSFVGFILGGALGTVGQGLAPAHYAIIAALGKEMEPAQPRPRAFVYYQFFASLTPESPGGWHQIKLLQDARAGDIMAWEQPGFQAGDNTGHVFLVAAPPIPDDQGIFSVQVYDSAQFPHFDDTRGEGESGVGSGVIKFTVDASGGPASFLFGPPDDPQNWSTVPIAIGRAEPL